MAAYRYLLRDVVSGALLAEMPFEQASYSHVLNAPGAFSGTMALKQPAGVQAVLRSALSLGRNTLFVERDGVIVWGGFLWTSASDVEAGTFQLAGEGFHSYYRRRLLRADKTYTGADQATIAVDLLDWAHNVVGGFVIVHTDAVATTGVLRDRTYLAVERHWVGEAIEQLAAVDGGFNFRYHSFWDPPGSSNIKTRFAVDYPASGQATDLVFEVGTQLSDLKVTGDATHLATHVDAIGATPTAASSPLIAAVADPARLAAMPMLDDVVNLTDVNVLATLEGHAKTRLKRGAAPVRIPQATADPALVPVLGFYKTGDVVTVRGSVGLETLDGKFRIAEYTVTVGDAGDEKVTLAFANLEVV